VSGKGGGRVFLSCSLALLLSCSLALLLSYSLALSVSLSLFLSLSLSLTHTRARARACARTHTASSSSLPPPPTTAIIHPTVSLVEVFWDGALSQRFFHMPDICKHLAVSTRKRLVRDIYRGDADLKLIDFLNRAKVLTTAVVSSNTAWHCIASQYGTGHTRRSRQCAEARGAACCCSGSQLSNRFY
jgi:hypothetical protein